MDHVYIQEAFCSKFVNWMQISLDKKHTVMKLMSFHKLFVSKEHIFFKKCL